MSKCKRIVGVHAWGAAVLVATLGCGPSAEELQQETARCDTLMMQRDSLREVIEDQAAAVGKIGQALAEVQLEEMALSAESPLAASRDSILLKIESLIQEKDRAQGRLWRTRQNLERHEYLVDSLQHALDRAAVSYSNLVVEEQEKRRALNREIDGLQQEKVSLLIEVERLVDEQNTVYYTIGTEQELLDQGIVEKVGGAHVLFFLWKAGETIVPSRDLDPGQFNAIDMRETTEIELPQDGTECRIISRQNVSALTTPPDKDGRLLGGSLEIADPAEFWDGSEFLIIVQS